MADEEDDDLQIDPLILKDIFSDPASILRTLPPVKEIAKDCVYVLDTNALLAPFKISQSDLKDVAGVLRKVAEKKQVFVPAQVLREFAAKRATKIANIYTHLRQLENTIPAKPKLVIPLLESSDPYKSVTTEIEGLEKQIKAYKDKLQKLTEHVRDWHWNDPVSLLYAEIFTTDTIIDHKLNDEDLLADLKRRNTHSIPPGFKDKAKDNGGAGDLMIWQSILELGRTAKKNVIFVTNDQKNDWYVRAMKQGLFTRYELIYEFQQQAGKCFALSTFANFVELLGAKPETVASVASELKGSVTSNVASAVQQSAVIGFKDAMRNISGAIYQAIPDAVSPDLLRGLISEFHSWHLLSSLPLTDRQQTDLEMLADLLDEFERTNLRVFHRRTDGPHVNNFMKLVGQVQMELTRVTMHLS